MLEFVLDARNRDYESSPGSTSLQSANRLDFTVTDTGIVTGLDYATTITCRAI